ncbi:hypothetical protein GOP47_0027357 [Adiantum capillus-veneris]|nr:hypothetical protein GOP47_0027357 [Adiantum capillus-veneris]
MAGEHAHPQKPPFLSFDSRILSQPDNAFSNRYSNMSLGDDDDDEEALKWAALEKLPTFDRLRFGILHHVSNTGSMRHQEIEISKLGLAEKRQLMEKVLHAIEEDNERFLLKLRERLDRVGIELPKIEVRFEHLAVEADVHVGSRALPTLHNFMINLVEGFSSFLVPPKKHVLKILKGLNGVVKPSRMTLLLGPPSSGKTTLLLALAGKLPPDLRMLGSVTYNGHEMTEFVPQRTSAYISQHDIQFAEMTVRETLDFSGCCQGVGTRFDMLMELSRREKAAGIKPNPDVDIFMKAVAMAGQETSIVTDYVLRVLGLEICADTLVGDQMRRGISGGQRKRVTTGEMLVGPAQAFFMDEISTGLDSSTTFQIVKCLQNIVHVMDVTMVVALLQPAPETFELFDDVILLSEGETVYQGPRECILDFFQSMGFQCPERKNVADFLQEVTSRKDQAQYWADPDKSYRFISVREFSESFKSFHVGQALQSKLARPFDKSKSHPAALSNQIYGISKVDLFKACFWREWLLTRRNSFLYIFEACQITTATVATMTVFLRTELHQDSIADANLYMGALFYGLIMIMFNGFNEMAVVVSRLPVFYKHRDLLFYPAWSYAIPSMIIRIPLSLLECLIWVCLTYYVIGFAPGPARFFSQLFLYFCLSQMALGLFRLIGALGRSMIIASSYGISFLMIIFVLGGFVISKDQIHKWWIWFYWISPTMYAQNGLVINEFLADRWAKPYNGSVDAQTIGTAILKARGFFTEDYWYWISIGALIGFAILYNILFTLALTYLNPLGRPQAIISEEDIRADRSNASSRGLQLSRLAAIEPETDYQGAQTKTSRRLKVDHITSEVQKKGMVLPFQPLSIAFNAINYYVDMPLEIKAQGVLEDKLQLLQDVSGAFRPGVLTALVGVSGAGKSTLMDVLAGRKTGGYIKGDIWISGYPKKQETFARISGYCEQNDIHSPNVTVLESLVYSAWLRLPADIDKSKRMMFVEEVMELVELNPLRNALVGLPGVNGLSTEQRKRLTIAVELVANPSIIFMDEPTSGLDARAAAIVMRTVRNTVDTGRTVVCTIHQPSIDIFESFDKLLLLKRGGQVIYAGPLGHQSCHLIDYFQAIPGVHQIKEGYNPAAWMLDISSPSVESQLGVDFAEIYRNSTLYQQNQALIKELSIPLPGSEDLSFATTYSQPFLQQCMACLWKQHWSYWRNPYYNAVRMLFTSAIALLCGTIFWNLGGKTDTVQDLSNVFGAIYVASLFLGFSNASTVEPVVDIERTVFYRERGAGMYSALPYAFAQAIIEIPYVLLQSVLFTLITYPMISFDWTAAKFFYYLFFLSFTLLYFTYYGMMCVAITPNVHFAAIITTFLFTFWNLFCGFIIPRKNIPVWWRWYSWANPVQWTLYGMIASQLGDIETRIRDPDNTGDPQSVRQYIEDTLGYKHDFLGVVAGMHLVWVFVFLFMFAYGIKKLNFQKR